MRHARTRITETLLAAALTLAFENHALANDHREATEPTPTVEKIAEPKPEKKPEGPVVAMDANKGKSLRAGELITAGSETMVLVSRDNFRTELSPHSVAEFDEQGILRLLRGSAVVESKSESAMSTVGARVEFVGRTLVSYDHLEKSSSVFVLEGEARMVNPHRNDSTLRLARFRGATLVVGGVVPQLVRQLDVGTVNSWLKGYSWPDSRREALLKNMPGQMISAKEETPHHLQETKLEDYFSSIDTADELHQPDYYQKKFDDPDKVVAEQNSVAGAGKVLSPEEAALISLPKNQINLDFDLAPEFLTAEQKQEEVGRVEPKSIKGRGLASVSPVAKAAPKTKKKKVSAEMDQGDPDVSLVLSRLRQVRSDKPVISNRQSGTRAPASLPESVVPDPVYDYSQNF